MAELLIAGFLLGVMGSFHCIGMCGPIALSLPVYNKTVFERYASITLYNAGRITSYTLLGVLFGFLGTRFFIGGYQQVLSITLGVAILVILLLAKYFPKNNSVFNFYSNYVRKILGSILQREKNFSTYFLIGFFNGLLPCGMVYIAIAGAVASGSVFQGAGFMAAFGLGTFPVMLSLSAVAKYISINVRNRMRRAMPVFISVMAVLLIFRGLNLGIPYISPEFNASGNTVKTCCHKK